MSTGIECDSKLPMELFYRVVECLDRKQDYATLVACSTVCRAFLPQCQRVLFRSIDLVSNEIFVRPFLLLLKDKPYLSSLIRRFQYLVTKNVGDEDTSAISELVLPNVETLVINGWMTYTISITEQGQRALAHLLHWPSIHTVEIQGFRRFPLRLLRVPTRISMLYVSPAGLSDGEYLVDDPPHAVTLATNEDQNQHHSPPPTLIKLEHLIIDRNVSSALLRKLSDSDLLCIDIVCLSVLQLALKPTGREAQSWPGLISALADFLQLLTSLRTFQITFPLYYNQPRIDLFHMLSPLLSSLTTLSIHWSGAQVDEEWFLGHLADTFTAMHQDNQLERVEIALEFTKIPTRHPKFDEEQSNWVALARAITQTANDFAPLRELSIQLALCELRGIPRRAWQDHYMEGPRKHVSHVARKNGFYLGFRVFWVQLQSGALRQSITPMGR